MDQKKIGLFLKEMRKEKGLTQSELAEKFYVSDRSVSRWENGNNMPDLSILIELADFYGLDIREILNGERKRENMNSDMKETLEKVSEYTAAEKQELKKRMIGNNLGAIILLFFAFLLQVTGGFGFIAERPCNNMEDFASGVALAILALNALYLSGALEKLAACKKKHMSK